jgi:hypothetical protein
VSAGSEDEAIATLSVSGTPEDFGNRMCEYLDAGVTYPIIGPVGDLETKIKTVKLAAQLFCQPDYTQRT